MKIAVVDLGTNTCRLFLARVEDGRVLQDARVTTVVRLGQGVDKYGRLHPDAVARTHACLSEYAPRIEVYGPERRLLVATSVLRDATDGRQFLRAVVAHDFHLPWRVLAGEEEGGLAFRGGTSWLVGAPAGSGPPGAAPDPLVLVDIGGGSTEFAVGSAGEPPALVRSLDVGVVRLTERFFGAIRRRRRRSRPWRATSPPPSRPRCRRTCAPPSAAWSVWPARTPRSSPTSSA